VHCYRPAATYRLSPPGADASPTNAVAGMRAALVLSGDLEPAADQVQAIPQLRYLGSGGVAKDDGELQLVRSREYRVCCAHVVTAVPGIYRPAPFL
jgi:hypothetical protein